MENKNQNQIVGAIIIAGVLIAGAILLKGSKAPEAAVAPNNGGAVATAPAQIDAADRILGNPNAKVAMILYEDFQCPFCGRFFTDSEANIRNTYVPNGTVQLVYRDFAFLGPESVQAAEASKCAGDQGKFWQYHDYLFTHQQGENQGNFSDTHLKTFAKDLGLNTATFNGCLDTNKYSQAINDAKNEATKAGVAGTPKGFIVTQNDISSKTQNDIIAALNQPAGQPPAVSFYTTKNIVSLNGALPWSMVKTVLDILLK